ncbi:TetR family transcriptional regulator [Arthrobacter sp. R-11]|uniref:TetR family transcriptional regulator n=1 Tax=Arthrobacter sp. R-11 TaxID=3404053 RepID=UPI003CEBA6B2
MQTSAKKKMGRPLTPRLSRKAIGRAALAMFEAGEDLSLPKLAERLEVTQSSFYKHVSGRQEIIELARGALVERARVPEQFPDTLDGVIRQTFEALISAYRLVPALLPLLLTQPVTHPAALGLYDHFVAAFEKAGVPAHLIIPAIEALDSAAIGASLDAFAMEAAWSIDEGRQESYPHLSMALDAVAASKTDRFTFLADVLAAGLKAAIDDTA